MIEFIVWGVAQTQGSSIGFVVKSKTTGRPRAVITSDNRKLKPWRREVATAAAAAMSSQDGRILAKGVAVRLRVAFYLLRPQSKRREPDARHTTRPDLDKLTRGVKDALTGVVWEDDGQVDEMKIIKRYAPVGAEPHAVIAVGRSVVEG